MPCVMSLGSVYPFCVSAANSGSLLFALPFLDPGFVQVFRYQFSGTKFSVTNSFSIKHAQTQHFHVQTTDLEIPNVQIPDVSVCMAGVHIKYRSRHCQLASGRLEAVQQADHHLCHRP